MRFLTALLLILPLSLADAAPKTDKEKTLYVLGVNISRQAAPFDLSAKELQSVIHGFRDKILKKPMAVDINAYGEKLRALHAERKARAAAKNKKIAAANMKKGKAFHKEFAKRKSAQVSKSGLIMIHTKKGDGPSPGPTDSVQAHVRGTLIDGTVTQDTFKTKKPMDFPINRVFKCWVEAIPQIKVGGKATLLCPAELAFGEMARPGIPAGSTLIYDVELLKITKSVPAKSKSSSPSPSKPSSKKAATKKEYTAAQKQRLRDFQRFAQDENAKLAQAELGAMYFFGRDVDQDIQEGLKWLKKAAVGEGTSGPASEAMSYEWGSDSAQNILGYAYANGIGMTKDFKKAFKWFRKAAEHGSRRGQFNLGNMYENGYGVEKDLERAVKWYRKAGAQGDKSARAALRRLER